MRIPVPDVIPSADELGRVHFVGIGGAALSGIARIMARQGVTVTGSDDHDTPFLPSLREIGVPCHLSYDASHVGDADTVVVTTAARDDNPEVLEARARGLRILPRSAGLKSVMAGRRVLAVAGTHGKTTTTSLLTMAVRACGADPTYAIGGVLGATGRNADAGSGDLFVAEADESDGAFLVYHPHAALVTNVDADHLDVWGSEAAYRAAFTEFVTTIDPDGFLVLCTDDPGAAALVEVARARDLRVVTVGVDVECDIRATGLTFEGSRSTFEVSDGGVGPRPGDAPGARSPLRPRRRWPPLPSGSGSGCRSTGCAPGSRPSPAPAGGWSARARPGECGSTTRTPTTRSRSPATCRRRARSPATGASSSATSPTWSRAPASSAPRWGPRSVRPTRSWCSTCTSPARTPTPMSPGRLVADAVPLPAERVHFVPDLDDAPAELVRLARPGDLVLTLGAGSVTDVGPLLLALLEDAP